MAIVVKVNRAMLSDGTWLDCREGLTVLVGPNNAGKSRFLRDIAGHLEGSWAGVVVKDLDFERTGDFAALTEWLQHNAHPLRGKQPREWARFGTAIAEPVLRLIWQSSSDLQSTLRWFVLFADAEQRLGLANAVHGFDPVSGAPSTALQYLYLRGEMEARLSAAVAEAFGVGLTLNRFANERIYLHWGTTDVQPALPTNPEYLDALDSLPLVNEQGDGVRSWVGLVLALISGTFQLVLVDEPEAFLHPPHARLLGARLAKEVSDETQVMVATHSVDVLRGLISDSNREVRVVRVTRDGDLNHAAVLEPSTVRELWSDPILRYSAALDGLFHSGVVVCEADADCRFYQASLDAALDRSGKGAADVLFTYAGGKHRMPKVAAALSAVGVPVRIIADIDVLREADLVERLLAALGGTWEGEDEKAWNVINAAVMAVHGPNPTVEAIQDQLTQLFDTCGELRLTPGLRDRVRDIVRTEDGWFRVKRLGGIAAIPAGDATRAMEDLAARLEARGLFLVPGGELESWDRAIPDHGPTWVAAALEADVHQRDGAHVAFVLRAAAGLLAGHDPQPKRAVKADRKLSHPLRLRVKPLEG